MEMTIARSLLIESLVTPSLSRFSKSFFHLPQPIPAIRPADFRAFGEATDRSLFEHATNGARNTRKVLIVPISVPISNRRLP